ncbi:OLC1v1015481C1 [Oldenlandia corymbosa var. corymbosa]|uniref:OLC1v1015481C1 n=1 Tax=Oldenlandia corymbosa var. corymbosa TaxID=529605 RepID=A0AAV1E3U1_OLDCO|nr:OLC1v1015481C1 [Oldenlandia corymbosa var. corymbosa]
MEDVRSLSIIGQRTFDADSFGYDRLGEIAQVAERALSVNATNVVRHDLDRHVEGEDEAEDEDEDEAEDADQDDQFEGQGYQRHEERGSSRL